MARKKSGAVSVSSGSVGQTWSGAMQAVGSIRIVDSGPKVCRRKPGAAKLREAGSHRFTNGCSKRWSGSGRNALRKNRGLQRPWGRGGDRS